MHAFVTNGLIGLATYIMLWPEDGRMKKEDIRGIYDGSIFYTIAARRAKNETASSGDIAAMRRDQVVRVSGL